MWAFCFYRGQQLKSQDVIKLIKELHRSKSTIGIYNKLRDVLLNERGYAKRKGYKSRKRELKEGNDIND